MALIVKTTIFRLPQPTDQIHTTAPFCQICDKPLDSNTLAARLSCCNGTSHAKCLSRWVDRNEGLPTASTLPECPRCRTLFSAAGYHDVMTDIACGDVTVNADATAKDVREIELVVTPVDHQSLHYSLYLTSRPNDRLPTQPTYHAPRDNRANGDDVWGPSNLVSDHHHRHGYGRTLGAVDEGNGRSRTSSAQNPEGQYPGERGDEQFAEANKNRGNEEVEEQELRTARTLHDYSSSNLQRRRQTSAVSIDAATLAAELASTLVLHHGHGTESNSPESESLAAIRIAWPALPTLAFDNIPILPTSVNTLPRGPHTPTASPPPRRHYRQNSSSNHSNKENELPAPDTPRSSSLSEE